MRTSHHTVEAPRKCRPHKNTNVILTDDDIAYAEYVGVRRHAESTRDGRVNDKYPDLTHDRAGRGGSNVRACMNELAVAKWLGIHDFRLTLNGYKDVRDVHYVEVKGVDSPHKKKLRVELNEYGDIPVILVRGIGRFQRLIGWRVIDEVRTHPEYLMSLRPGDPPKYCVHETLLFPMDTLPFEPYPYQPDPLKTVIRP